MAFNKIKEGGEQAFPETCSAAIRLRDDILKLSPRNNDLQAAELGTISFQF